MGRHGAFQVANVDGDGKICEAFLFDFKVAEGKELA